MANVRSSVMTASLRFVTVWKGKTICIIDAFHKDTILTVRFPKTLSIQTVAQILSEDFVRV